MFQQTTRQKQCLMGQVSVRQVKSQAVPVFIKMCVVIQANEVHLREQKEMWVEEGK